MQITVLCANFSKKRCCDRFAPGAATQNWPIFVRDFIRLPMPTRRQFLQTLPLGLSAAPALAQLPQWPGQVTDDEAYWQQVRAQFPLARDRAYFNNGTNGPSPYPVIEAQQRAMDELERTGEYGSPEPARAALARFLRVPQAEICLTHNTTEGINLMAWGLPLRRGDEVLVTDHEHAGNALPWLNRAKRSGIRLKVVPLAPTAAQVLERIDAAIGWRTRVLALPHIACTTGQVLPAKEMAQLGRDRGLWVCLDGAHGPGSTLLDLPGLGCDAYAACCHKWMLGPKGTGFLYVRAGMLDTLQVQHLGAHADTGWDLRARPPVLRGYVPTAHRYDYGTQNAATYAGVTAAVDFWDKIGAERAIGRAQALAERLQTGLLALPDRAEMLTPTEAASRGTMIGFRPRHLGFRAFNDLAARHGFRLRVVPEGGLDSIRVSTHFYNHPDEVDRLLALVAQEA
jgi:cysteine desulfurase / selenocysteine lyase